MSWNGLTDEQWAKVKECLPVRKRPWLKRKRGGRPPADDRKCFEGSCGFCGPARSGKRCRSNTVPKARCTDGFPNGSKTARWRSCGELFWQSWKTPNSFVGMNVSWAEPLPAPKKGPKVGKTKRGKGTKLMVLVDGAGTPVGRHVDSASPSEMKLALPTIKTIKVVNRLPKELIADKGYDSNKVRSDLVDLGIEPIIPARENNKKATHQDGRKLRKYRRRWIVERTNAWIQNYRRLVVRYERSADIYTDLVHMALCPHCSSEGFGMTSNCAGVPRL